MVLFDTLENKNLINPFEEITKRYTKKGNAAIPIVYNHIYNRFAVVIRGTVNMIDIPPTTKRVNSEILYKNISLTLYIKLFIFF